MIETDGRKSMVENRWSKNRWSKIDGRKLMVENNIQSRFRKGKYINQPNKQF